MAIDTPARIAILGAGPIGLEAALYARFLGYEVDVYERGDVTENVCRWGHVRLFSPFSMNHSSLGLAAISAQDPNFQAPDNSELLTGREWAARYLQPLARTDLLADSLKLNTEVLGVGKNGILKHEAVGSDDRADATFHLLLRKRDKSEFTATADAVIDTTGVYGNPNWLGRGGIPAIGETRHKPRIISDLPDVLGHDRSRFSGKHTLVVGGGYSAATSIVALAELAAQEPTTTTTWLTRPARSGTGPIPVIDNDSLPERARLATRANELAAGNGASIRHIQATIRSLQWVADDKSFQIETDIEESPSIVCDSVVSHVGFRPDRSIYRELQVHECYASEGPMQLAGHIMGQSTLDCTQQDTGEPRALVCPEPDFYILGSKSYGRNSTFLFSLGLEQIRQLFSILADRDELDLYASSRNLVT